MSKATPESITSGLPGWDADTNTNFDLVFEDACPLASFANAGALPTASTNEESLAILEDEDVLVISDGTNWKRVGPPESIIVAAGDETTVLVTGTALVTFRMPYAFTITEVRASLTTADNALLTVDINEGGTSIMTTTKLTIDSGELTSTTAATPAVLTDTALADDAQITIDIDTAGTAGTGLKVYLIGRSSL